MQQLGLAYAAGLNLYATVAITGLAVRFGWVHGVPTTIEASPTSWVIGIAVALYGDRIPRHADSRRRVGVGDAALL